MSKKILYCLLLVSLFLCLFINNSFALEKLSISVGISPIGDLIKKISLSDEIFILLPENASPANYDLTPSQLLKIMKSDFFFIAGTPFERQIASKLIKITQKVKIVDLSKELNLLSLDGSNHSHKCSASNLDPHFWLSPDLMCKALKTAVNELILFKPENKQIYLNEFKKLKIQFDSLKIKVNSILSSCKGKNMFVYHPAFGYLTNQNNIKQISIENLGKNPGAQHLKKYLEIAKISNIKTIFIQKQFPVKTAKSLSNHLKCKIIYLDPMVNNYFKDIIELCNKIKINL